MRASGGLWFGAVVWARGARRHICGPSSRRRSQHFRHVGEINLPKYIESGPELQLARQRTAVSPAKHMHERFRHEPTSHRIEMPMTRVPQRHEPVMYESKAMYRAGREPSFTAMWHACLRNTHATTHASPVFVDARSVQLVPVDVRQRVQAVMGGFSPGTADAIVLMSVIRQRVLAERLRVACKTSSTPRATSSRRTS